MSTIEDWGRAWHTPSQDRRGREDHSEGMWWPAGRHVVPHSRLKQILARSARWHARKAIESFVSEDLDDLLQAAVSTGSAVELITKAYIVSVSPALLADKGDRDSVLMLTGNGPQASSGALRMKSIGAVAALQVAKHLQKDLPADLPDPIALRVRNSATHMACVTSPDLRAAVIQMCRLITALLPALQLDPEPFWGEPRFQVVRDLLDEAKSEVTRTVTAKRAAAMMRLVTLTSAIPADQVGAFLTALAGRPQHAWLDHEERHACPVCGQQGWLVCGVERGPLEYEVDEDGDVQHWVSRTAYPIAFLCPVCELDVEGDELVEFDFPAELELEPDGEPYEGYEPDEDMYRDR